MAFRCVWMFGVSTPLIIIVCKEYPYILIYIKVVNNRDTLLFNCIMEMLKGSVKDCPASRPTMPAATAHTSTPCCSPCGSPCRRRECPYLWCLWQGGGGRGCGWNADPQDRDRLPNMNNIGAIWKQGRYAPSCWMEYFYFPSCMKTFSANKAEINWSYV